MDSNLSKSLVNISILLIFTGKIKNMAEIFYKSGIEMKEKYREGKKNY